MLTSSGMGNKKTHTRIISIGHHIRSRTRDKTQGNNKHLNKKFLRHTRRAGIHPNKYAVFVVALYVDMLTEEAETAERHARRSMLYKSSPSSYVTTIIILICFFLNSEAIALNSNRNASRNRARSVRDSVLSATDMNIMGDTQPPSASSTTTTSCSTQPANGENVAVQRQANSLTQISQSLSVTSEDNSRRDVFLHLFSCFGAACGLSTYEDYDCVNLKPSRATLRRQYVNSVCNNDDDYDGDSAFPSECRISSPFGNVGAATKGMGEGERERIGRFVLDESVNSRDNIPSYNEIMMQHRSRTVTRWNKVYDFNDGSSSAATAAAGMTKEDVRNAVDKVYMAIKYLEDAADKANDYDWDGLHDILQSSGLRDDLAYACSVLHGSKFLGRDAKDEIGFDWGSCAWRHCGAQADAQEAIAELDRSVGMLEPYECLFCLDIADRALRDILSNVPNEFHPTGSNRLKVRYLHAAIFWQ